LQYFIRIFRFGGKLLDFPVKMLVLAFEDLYALTVFLNPFLQYLHRVQYRLVIV
jgi:hypothetical protein